MRMPQARAELSAWITTNTRAAFERALEANLEDYGENLARYLQPELFGPDSAGHDPRAVPHVPTANLVIQRDRDHDPTIIYTYKVEQGAPPCAALHLRRNWLAAVAHRDQVLLGGYPVLDVTARDSHQRPTVILTALISGSFDHRMHGWRAHAWLYEADVDWHDDDTARVHPGAARLSS